MTTRPGRAEPGFLDHVNDATTGATISSGDGYEQDPTRRIEVPNEPATPRSGYAGEPLEGEADFARSPSTDEESSDYDLEEEPESRRGRDIGLAVAGALLGVVLTFVFIALTTGGDTTEVGDDPAVAERDAELAEREQQIEELDARIADLESQLAAAGDAGADRDAELAAQRDALDDRLASIEARVEELDNRQASLDERADALDQRERAISEAETEGEPPTDGDTGDDRGEGIDLDDLSDTAEGAIERVLEEIRNLFGQS